MRNKNIPRAKLLNSIPHERYRIMLENTDPPKEGDIVELDQGFTNSDGQEMVLVYCVNKDQSVRYEAEVYDYELTP